MSPTVSEGISESSEQITVQRHITPPSSSPSITPTHKYWTLPRNVAASKKLLFHDQEFHHQIITDQPPPPNARFLCETDEAKYFTLPASTIELTTSKKQTDAHIKTKGIGSIDDSGIPTSLKSVNN